MTPDEARATLYFALMSGNDTGDPYAPKYDPPIEKHRTTTPPSVYSFYGLAAKLHNVHSGAHFQWGDDDGDGEPDYGPYNGKRWDSNLHPQVIAWYQLSLSDLVFWQTWYLCGATWDAIALDLWNKYGPFTTP